METTLTTARATTMPTDTTAQVAPTTVEFEPWPVFQQEERDVVSEILASGKVNYWTGQEGRRFETEYAQSLGRNHAVAVHNGTLSLELALWALGIGPGDEVITPSRTFVATASSAVMRGATPVIVDVERDSGNLSAATIEPHITPRTRAIIVVHLAGWPVEMDPILDLAAIYDIAVIEDCAQAHGAEYRGRPVGSIGTVGTFSFCQEKIVSTGGEGGLMTTDDEEVFRRAWALKDHGKSYEAVYEREHPPGFRWLHEDFGTNWRMLEMQAAIGRIQLRRLPAMGERRRRNAAILDEGLEALPGLRIERAPAHTVHAKYKHYVYVRPEALKAGWSRDRIMVEVAQRGVPTFSGSCSEIYREGAFCKAGFAPAQRHPVARELGDTSLMFLVHPTLTDEHMAHTVDVVSDVVRSATR